LSVLALGIFALPKVISCLVFILAGKNKNLIIRVVAQLRAFGANIDVEILVSSVDAIGFWIFSLIGMGSERLDESRHQKIRISYRILFSRVRTEYCYIVDIVGNTIKYNTMSTDWNLRFSSVSQLAKFKNVIRGVLVLARLVK
jgi:hypothetical protein